MTALSVGIHPASSVAARLSDDPKTQAAIERLLERNGFTARECEAVLKLVDAFIEGAHEVGGEVTPDVLMRGAAVAVDTIWCARSAREVAR